MQAAFPAWGPIQYSGTGHLSGEHSPLISIYKRGYKVQNLNNSESAYYLEEGVTRGKKSFSLRDGMPKDAIGKFIWNGEVTRMKRVEEGDVMSLLQAFSYFCGDVRNSFDVGPESSSGCDWKKIPKTIVFIESEKQQLSALYGKRFYAMGISTPLSVLAANEKRQIQILNCGSPITFFETYAK